METVKPRYISGVQIARYGVLVNLLKAMYTEFQELSKKKPQEIVSASKVKIANRILDPVLELLENEPTRQFLDLLDADDLPQNSDAVLMLGQAVAAMQAFKTSYYSPTSGWKRDPSESR